MCKNPASPYLVGLSRTERKAVVIKSDCDSWECEECAKKKQAQWCARAILGLQQIQSRGITSNFVTITSAEWSKSFAQGAAAFPRAWSKLYARLKRKNPALMYLLIVEAGKKTGHFHAHFLTDAQQNVRWYKNNARAVGLGYQAKVEKIEDRGKVAAYVAKYIGKSLGGDKLPRHFRRVRCSQNWSTLAQLENHQLAGDCDWLVCNTTSALWSTVERCQQEKRIMIDAGTGEYFDFQDACEKWYA